MPIRTLARTITVGTAVLAAILVVPLGLMVATGATHPARASGCGIQPTTATSDNTVRNWTSTGLIGADTLVFVTSEFGNTGVYLNHPLGVWYTGSAWAIFNQDLAAMPVGATFDVVATGTQFSPSVDTYTHAATGGNIAYNWTVLDDPLANGNPNAIVTATQNWNPGGVGGTYNNHPIGVWYTGSRWAIFNQDLAAMPVGAAFNVMVRRGPTHGLTFAQYTHTSSSASVTWDWTVLSSPTFRTSPTGLGFPVMLIVTPNWNPGGVGGAYHTHNLGVWWTGSQWSIFNQDVAAMDVGHSFNVYWQTC